jgi:hypothetical protein
MSHDFFGRSKFAEQRKSAKKTPSFVVFERQPIDLCGG